MSQPRLITRLTVRYPWLTAPVFWLKLLLRPGERPELLTHLNHYRALRRRMKKPFARPARAADSKTVLVFSYGDIPTAYAERVVIAGFEGAGYRPIVLAPNLWPVRRALRFLGLSDLRWFYDYSAAPSEEEVEAVLASIETTEDLLKTEYQGVGIGKFIASTLMRNHRIGKMDVGDERVRRLLPDAVRASMSATRSYQRLCADYRPDIVLMNDQGYTPFGEAFEVFLTNDIPVVLWACTHEDGHTAMKRYDIENKDEHVYALADGTWKHALAMQWHAAFENRLDDTMTRPYETQSWFSVMGTQFNTKRFSPRELTERLDLDPKKKTAIIFPHMFWDAAFFWGEDLFDCFENWFRAVLKAACANTDLNWAIKVHPGNVVKKARDGVEGEFSEIVAVRETVGELPPHVKLIRPDTDISTLSLFDIMDYCLTIRGTIGLESAARGIRTLTGGTGRYDRRGFTLDFKSPEELLETIGKLHTIPAMTEDETALARRYALAFFIARSMPMESVDWGYERDRTASFRAAPNFTTRDELMAGRDVRRIADWLRSSDADLCVWPDGETAAASANEDAPAGAAVAQ